MPPRTRRSAAIAAAQLVADMQMESSDEDTEEQIDIEDDEELDEIDADEDAGADDDGDDEPPATTRGRGSKAAQPKLKITLKLPNATSSAGTATPDDAEAEFAAFKRTPRRKAKAKVIHDNDIESEDSTSPEDSEDEEPAAAISSRAAGTSSGRTRPLTNRQAVLASMVDPTHVSLDEPSKSKKAPLNETELALRREENARKRKNLSEKRLEDEKAQTINRLLKKQSRPRNKRTNTTDSPLPASGAQTPKVKQKSAEDAEDGEGDEEEEEAMEVVEYQEPVKPTMYRWVSSLREAPSAVEGGEKKIELLVTFSVPESIFPLPLGANTSSASSQIAGGAETSAKMDVDPGPRPDPELARIQAARGPGICAVIGCGQPRKYRSVKDWTIGACGSEHLRLVA